MGERYTWWPDGQYDPDSAVDEAMLEWVERGTTVWDTREVGHPYGSAAVLVGQWEVELAVYPDRVSEFVR